MEESTPRDLFIGVGVFLLIILSGLKVVAIFTNPIDGYSTGTDNQLLKDFSALNKSAELEVSQDRFEESVDNIESASSSSNEGIWSAFGVAGSLLQGAWAGISGIADTFSFVVDLFDVIEDLIGIPPFITSIISLLVVGVLIFMVLTLIFNRKV